MPTNLQLTVSNFVRSDGYFYTIDVAGDTLYKKTDDGNNAFSYPLDTDMVNTVQSLQFDGRYFYTLENLTTANGGNGQILIKRWEVDDFILKRKNTYTINGISNRKLNANALAIEHYTLAVSGYTAISGSSTVTGTRHVDRMEAGDIIYLGPSTFTGDEGKFEERTVVSGNQNTGEIFLSQPLTKSFNQGDRVIFSNKAWFFNKFKLNDPDSINGSGALYSIDLNFSTLLEEKTGNEFKDILAATFIRDPYYGGTGRDFLAYMKQTNLLFIEVDPDNAFYRQAVQSAAQNNQETNTNVITVYAVTYENETIFRLQQKATFRNGATYTTEDWSPKYNYQLSTIQRLPAAISLSASRNVISADGVSTSLITALVTDQFDEPVGGRPVTFDENDTVGVDPGHFIGTNPATTTSGGIATITYEAGTNPSTITLTANT